MSKINKFLWPIASFVFATGFTFLLFPSLLIRHGYIMSHIEGDAGKNIFTYLYHILYEKGIWFTGMNYPYGEHIMYTDGQPILSVTLSYFKHITLAQALDIMSWCIAGSYFLAIIFVYKILLHFEVKPFIALLFSGLIISMSPQLYRTLGHFGLSYACIIPMLFYWTIQYNITNDEKYPVYIFILGFIATFLHPYHSAIILIWVSFYSLGYYIFTKAPFMLKARHLLPLLSAVLLLFVITGSIIWLTDPFTDRPVAPYGMLVYRTGLKQIFTSFFSPVWPYVVAHVRRGIENRSREEGFTYVGLSALAAVFLSLAKGFVNMVRKADTPPSAAPRSFQPVWLFIACAALLLAMGVPFIWHMEWIADYLSFLRQFRTLGRFSWIFYYIIAIYGAVVIYRCYDYYLVRGRYVIAYTGLLFAFALWSFEASGYIRDERNELAMGGESYDIMCGKNEHSWEQFLAGRHYKANDFQAQLFLRFSHIGSDKLWLGREHTGMQIAAGLEIGLQLHLPMIDAIMARSSWSITEKQVKISAGPFVHKPMLDDLKSNKPFLLLNADTDSLDADDEYLISASDSIGLYNSWRVYACYPDRIKANDKKNQDSISRLLQYIKTGDTCITYKGAWYVNHFDSGKAKQRFFGQGADSYMPQEFLELFNVPVTPVYSNQQYEFSCWFLLSNKSFKAPFCHLDLQDSNGKVISTVFAPAKESTDNKGLWFRAVRFFPVPVQCRRIKCRLENYADNTYEVMDELLLRPSDALIISRSASGEVMVNNHSFPQ